MAISLVRFDFKVPFNVVHKRSKTVYFSFLPLEMASMCTMFLVCSIGRAEINTGHESQCKGSNHSVTSLDKEKLKLVQLRSGVKCVEDLCDLHRRKFLYCYALHQKICCDPYSIHAKLGKNKKGAFEVTLSLHDKTFSLKGFVIIPGKKLCLECKFRLYRSFKM